MSQLFHFLHFLLENCSASIHTFCITHSKMHCYSSYIVLALKFLCQYILLLATKVIAVQTSEAILQHMVMQCFKRPQKKQRVLPQKCAFACNCWFALPYFTSFVVSVEYTPMWSYFLCLSMIRQYVTAVMIRVLTVRATSCLDSCLGSGRCSPAPPVGRQMKRVTQQGCVSMCVHVTQCVGLW